MTGDVVEVLAASPDRCARLIFADPPYNLDIDYGAGKHTDLLPVDDYLDWCRRWTRQCARLLTNDGSLWVMMPDEWAGHVDVMLTDLGLYRRNWIKWYESFGTNCTRKFNRTSRHILYFVKNPSRFVFNADAVRVPSDRQTKYNDKRANPDGKIMDDVWHDIPRLAGTHAERIPGFPTQLPVAITDRIIACASELGDLIVDPFCGSGTTGVSAVNLDRRFLGVELNPGYAERARQRLAVAGEQKLKKIESNT